LVPNLKIKDLFPSYSVILTSSIAKLGMLFEKLVTASLAVKYYLCRLQDNKKQLRFGKIYYKDSEVVDSEGAAWAKLRKMKIDFSEGIDHPTDEATVDSSTLKHAVSRNDKNKTAHHDMILYSNKGLIAVQAKASLRTPTPKAIKSQLKVHKGTDRQVDLLIWIFLGDLAATRLRRSNFEDKVVFLDGSGVCNGMSLDLLRSSKMVQGIKKSLA
jgi:hypothetical protein